MSFSIDTLYHFPIVIPDASLTQDGVMTKAQVALLLSLVAGTIFGIALLRGNRAPKPGGSS